MFEYTCTIELFFSFICSTVNFFTQLKINNLTRQLDGQEAVVKTLVLNGLRILILLSILAIIIASGILDNVQFVVSFIWFYFIYLLINIFIKSQQKHL